MKTMHDRAGRMAKIEQDFLSGLNVYQITYKRGLTRAYVQDVLRQLGLPDDQDGGAPALAIDDTLYQGMRADPTYIEVAPRNFMLRATYERYAPVIGPVRMPKERARA